MAEPASPPLRVRDHVLLAAAVAGAQGLVEGNRLGSPRAVALCAALLVLGGAVVGLVQAGLFVGLRGLWRYARAGWPAPPEGDEQRLRARATILAAVLCGGLGLAALRPAALRLLDVHDPGLVAALLLVCVGLVAGVAVFATPIVAGLIHRPLRELDRSVDVALPPEPPVRRFLLLALPVGLATAWLQRAHAKGLKPFALELGGVMFCVAEAGALALAAWLPASLRELVRRTSGRLLAGLLALAGLVLVGGEGDRKLHEDIGRSVGAGAVQRQLRRLGDVDGDGASAWLGGGDCAAWDATRGPLAVDVPGNRVDEDCDGADAWSWSAARAPQVERLHGRLDPALVRDYNVVWIIVDAVRANHLSAYGYPRATSPYLEHLAGESLVFRRAYSQSSATMLSIPSMLAGRPVGTMRFERGDGILRAHSPGEPLAEVLQRHGYRTGFVVDGYVTNRLPGALAGFETVESTWVDGNARPWNTRYAATAVTKAIEFLERDSAAEQPFFLAVYMADPHAPYVEHPEVTPFGKGTVARYDGELAYTDHWIGVLVEYLRAKPPLLDDTIVVVVADHGEEFNDHGGTQHARTCHEESTHVPLLLRVPGLAPGEVELRVGLNDIVPTFVELLGLDLPLDQLDGQSLLIPALAPGRVAPDRPIYCSVLSQRASQGDFLRHAVRVGRHALHQDVLDQRLELYDVLADPREKKPLDLSDPRARATAEHLESVLRGHLTGNIEDRLLTR
ncbi:MAG: sulfatase-like hydrolase/transferase [Myxococcales bacterium]|nr:sulfatase-like hydrolase/transferase [Myxococcales bacterium]